MSNSNGYEEIASTFIQLRGQASNGIGTASVREWARTLPQNAAVLDLGCGTGLPITKVLIEEGAKAYAVDASPTLVKAFKQNFPGVPVVCETAEDSSFFNMKFDGIIAWGLLFLLPEEAQTKVIQKAGNALKKVGKILFTAPSQQTEWQDVLTGQLSISLGAKKYRGLLSASGLSLIEEFEDEGENHYYHGIKT